MKRRAWLLLLLAAGLLLFSGAAQAVVELVSFTAQPSNHQVTLNWTTATELDTLGF